MKYVYVYQIFSSIYSQFFYPLLLLSELMFPMVLVLVVGVADLWVPSVTWFDRVKMSETKKDALLEYPQSPCWHHLVVIGSLS